MASMAPVTGLRALAKIWRNPLASWVTCCETDDHMLRIPSNALVTREVNVAVTPSTCSRVAVNAACAVSARLLQPLRRASTTCVKRRRILARIPPSSAESRWMEGASEVGISGGAGGVEASGRTEGA